MNGKFIPDLDKNWADAEKLLDRHFRRRKFMVWIFSLTIPAILIGLSFLLNHNSEKSPSISGDQKTHKESNSGNISVPDNRELKTESQDKSKTSGINTPITSNKSTGEHVGIQHSIGNSSRNNSIGRADFVPANLNSKTNHSFQSLEEDFSERGNSEALTSLQGDLRENVTLRKLRFGSLNTDLMDYPSLRSTEERKSTYMRVGLEAMVYGSVMYVQKMLSAEKNSDNYLIHRKNEEEAILTPSLGLAISANWKSLGLSIGAEYTYVGERTNYYPYSDQLTLVNNGHWHLFQSNFVDTDTAYIMGNPLFVSTVVQRIDSSFIITSDTIYEYKYNQEIALNNGVNRIYYLEFPIEISYAVTRGRMGIGFSGGIAPGILTGQRGHYIRDDGRGIESFDEVSYFRKFMINGRFSADFFYRAGARTKIVVRPQLRANLNSVFKSESGVKQKYYSTGLVFGVAYLLN